MFFRLIPNAKKVARKSYVIFWLIMGLLFSALEIGLPMMYFPEWVSPNLISIVVMFCIIMGGISRFIYQEELHGGED